MLITGGLLPIVLGLLLTILLRTEFLPNLRYQASYRFDLMTVTFWAGLILSVVALIWLWSRNLTNRRIDSAVYKERDLQRASYNRFLDGLEHQLKNSLQNISTAVEGLKGNPHTSSEQMTFIYLADKHVERLTNLKDGLYMLANPERLEMNEVDLNEALENAIDSTRSIPGRHDKHIEMRIQELPWPMGPVWGDQDMLFNAFHNLIDNALKYTGDDGKVEVRAFENGQMAVIEVVDNGQGIPSEEHALIFEPLFRGADSHGIEGSGLGLALVKQIVDLHGGEIAIRSREGQGTIMTIILPLAPSSDSR